MPDLATYRLHRVVTDTPFEGTPGPGLRAEFYHRPDGDRVASVGRCSYAGRELLLAWGHVDEEHCRHSAVRDPDGSGHAATSGCPTIRVERTGDVTGLAVRTPVGDSVRTAN